MSNSEVRNISKDRKYLVTGASGFIGQAVCAQLLEMGAQVYGASRRNVNLTKGLTKARLYGNVSAAMIKNCAV